MGSLQTVAVATLLVVAIACFWTAPTEAARCQPMRCDNGTAKSPRCKKTDTMPVCLGQAVSQTFDLNFVSPPEVHYGLSRVDIKGEFAQAAGASISDVTKDGFAVTFHCEHGAFCFGVDVNWMACGMVA